MTTSTTPCRYTALTPGMPPRFERFRFMSADAGSAGTTGAGAGDTAGQPAGAGDPPGETAGTAGTEGGDPGFPKDTPVKDMTAEQQAAYWKHQARRHQSRADAAKDYDQIKAERDELKARTQTAEEKAIEEAKAAGRAAALAEAAPRLLQAEFRAAAAGRLTAEQLRDVTDPLDPNKFLTSTGEVDTDKVKRFVDGVAPSGNGTWPDMGGGRRGGDVKQNAREAGKAAAERRFGKKTA